MSLAIPIGLTIFLLASISYESTVQPADAVVNNSTNSSTTMQSMNAATTSGSNATTTTNLTSLDTFSAAGSISSLIYPSVTMPTASPSASANAATTTNGNATFNIANASGASILPPKTFILSGFWHLKINNGNITFFDVRFTKVHLDATNRHTHEITNFTMTDSNNNNTSVKLNANGSTTITGTTDVALNNAVAWRNVKTTIMINNLSTIIISLDPKDTSNHFIGQSICGIVNMIRDKNGNDIEHFPSIILR